MSYCHTAPGHLQDEQVGLRQGFFETSRSGLHEATEQLDVWNVVCRQARCLLQLMSPAQPKQCHGQARNFLQSSSFGISEFPCFLFQASFASNASRAERDLSSC